MIKKTCLVLAALMLMCCCTACTRIKQSSETKKTTILIGVSLYDQYDTFLSVFMQEFNRHIQELAAEENIKISVLQESAALSQIKQNNQIDGFVKSGCDVICVNLVDRTDATFIIDKAKEAGIPVVFFNRELVEEDLDRWDRLYYVGAPAEESGEKQAEIVMDFCKKDMPSVDRNGDGVLQYVMLEGEAGHQDAIMRTETSVNTLVKSGFKVERLEDEIANWSKEQAETKMSLWIQTHGRSIEVVFANNDDMALGAIWALEKAFVPQAEWPLIVGVDGTPYGLDAIKDKKMSGTVFNDYYGQAEKLFELSWALASTGQPPESMHLENGKYCRLPYKILTADNHEEILGIIKK